MAEAQAESLAANDWSGGVHPYRVSHRKLGMWLFLATEVMFFGGLFAYDGVCRFRRQTR